MRMLWITLALVVGSFLHGGDARDLKILHICFSDECVREMEGIAEALSMDIVSMNFLSLPAQLFDRKTEDPQDLYQMTQERAHRNPTA